MGFNGWSHTGGYRVPLGHPGDLPFQGASSVTVPLTLVQGYQSHFHRGATSASWLPSKG